MNLLRHLLFFSLGLVEWGLACLRLRAYNSGNRLLVGCVVESEVMLAYFVSAYVFDLTTDWSLALMTALGGGLAGYIVTPKKRGDA